MIARVEVFVVALMLAMLSALNATTTRREEDEGHQHPILIERTHQNVDAPKLNMTLCFNKCSGENCKSYITPLSKCYSSSLLFPNDPSWSGKDVIDDVICQTLVRTIFETKNSTCRGPGDIFQIPMNECVGPFGKPRPWGIFNKVIERGQEHSEKYHGKDGSGLLSLCANGVPGRAALND